MGRFRYIETMMPVVKGRTSEASGLDDQSSLHTSSLFDAILRPNRSLSNSGFRLVMSIVVGVNLVLGGFFFAIGAWPVLGFCGLDILIVWLAFKLSYRQGRLCERVRVTHDEMWVARVLPSGHETRWRLQPYWVRVHIERPVAHESQVCVTSKGKILILGAFLSPDERGDFAEVLSGVLGQARGSVTQI